MLLHAVSARAIRCPVLPVRIRLFSIDIAQMATSFEPVTMRLLLTNGSTSQSAEPMVTDPVTSLMLTPFPVMSVLMMRTTSPPVPWTLPVISELVMMQVAPASILTFLKVSPSNVPLQLKFGGGPPACAESQAQIGRAHV